MSKLRVAKNISVKDIRNFDDLYDEISSTADLKAQRLLSRREKELRRQNAW